MNYLAHALLSEENSYELMGNLWGDLLRPKDYSSLHPNVMEGIRRHKMIDRYTDQHPSVHVILNLLRPYQGKYTPVVSDVLMDYMLSKYWERFSAVSIEDFCSDRYKLVMKYIDLIPERLHPRINRMVSHRWLESCKNKERMEETLKMLSRRASFENHIPDALIPYELHASEMDEKFLEFFGELRKQISLQNAH